MVVANDAQLIEHIPGEIGAAVVERRQQPEDPQVAVQLEADGVDDLDEVGQTLHRVVLRLDRDDDAVRCHETIDREQAKVGWAVDQDVVVAIGLSLDRLTKDLLPPERRKQFALGRGEVDVGGGDIDARALGGTDDLGEARATVREDIRHRAFDDVEIDPEPRRQVRLGIHIDAEDPQALFREGAREIDRRGRLAHAALLVGDRDHIGHLGITSNHRRGWTCRLAGKCGDVANATAAWSRERPGYPHGSRVVHHFGG
jgi:hypothetical protein